MSGTQHNDERTRPMMSITMSREAWTKLDKLAAMADPAGTGRGLRGRILEAWILAATRPPKLGK